MGTDAHDPGAEHSILTPRKEMDFGIVVRVRIRSHGHLAIHGPQLRARVERELKLAFGEDKVGVGPLEGLDQWEREWASQLGATPSSSGPESSATGGSSNGSAQTAE